MVKVDVIVVDDGDGWLEVDTDEWIEDKLGESDQELTEDLREWLLTNGASPDRCTAPADWVSSRFRNVQGPGCDDAVPFLTLSNNGDNLLSEDMCVMILRTCIEGMDQTLAVVNHDQVYVLGPSQEWVDVVDWRRAYGQCPEGHRHVVEGACLLHSDTSQQIHRVGDLCREHEDRGGGYVACPDCGRPVAFFA